MQASDEELMVLVSGGDAEALEVLYNRYALAVMGLIMRIVEDRGEAEELVQEAFWRVWNRSDAFNPQKGNFTNWLFTISRNLALDKRRRQTVRPQAARNETEALQMELSYDSSVNVPDSAWSAIRHRQVRQAMTSLPLEQYEVIALAYFEGLTRREIAQQTNTPLGTVHTRARLALSKLRQLLDVAREEEV